ncbi:unnamed protein product [Musa hybrid cultivar]
MDQLLWKYSVEMFQQSGWSDAQVTKLIKRAPNLLNANVETALKPRMRRLQDMGFSDSEIVQLVSSCPCVLILRDIEPRINFWRSRLGSNERLLKACKKNIFDATSATLMSFGCSQPDIVAVFRKCPYVWTFSKKTICDKMTFLMKEVGFELKSIIRCPVILTCSLEKRLRPRYEVLNFLKRNKLLDEGHNLLSVIQLTEEKFIKKYLFQHKEKFTSLYDSYLAAVQGKPYVVT